MQILSDRCHEYIKTYRFSGFGVVLDKSHDRNFGGCCLEFPDLPDMPGLSDPIPAI